MIVKLSVFDWNISVCDPRKWTSLSASERGQPLIGKSKITCVCIVMEWSKCSWFFVFLLVVLAERWVFYWLGTGPILMEVCTCQSLESVVVVSRLYIVQRILRFREDSQRLYVTVQEWTAFYSVFLNIHRSGVLTVLAWQVPHVTAAISARSLYTIQPCTMLLSCKATYVRCLLV